MSVSELGMANRALIRLGATTTTNLAGTDRNAVICNALMGDVIDEVLCEYPWKCVENRATLSKVYPPPIFGYAYQYELPDDPYCLVPHKLFIGSDEATSPWVLEERYILTDQDDEEEDVSLLYTQRIDDITILSTWVEGLIVLRLAYEACFAITQSNTLKTEIWNDYQDSIVRAKMRDGRINYVDGEDGNMDWVDAGR